MELQGSCHCGRVKFSVLSHTPRPFMKCYCSICRKTGAGFNINIMGVYKTLKVEGEGHLRTYRAIRDPETKELCGNIRYFCSECGCYLYAYDKTYAEYVYPFASAIDTPLPAVDDADSYNILINSKSEWVSVPKSDHVFDNYPDVSLEDWHKNNNKYIE
ncbi:unnamed protein product [Cunninghamella blakesleeana]